MTLAVFGRSHTVQVILQIAAVTLLSTDDRSRVRTEKEGETSLKQQTHR